MKDFLWASGSIVSAPKGLVAADGRADLYVDNPAEIGPNGFVLSRAIFGQDGQDRTLSALSAGLNKNAKASLLKMDGHFALVRPDIDGITIATDIGGSIPVYVASSERKAVVGTKPDLVAREFGSEAIDTLSVHDFALNGTICHPFTWFREVRALNPASLTIVGHDGVKSSYYWTPKSEPEHSIDAAAPQLLNLLCGALAKVTDGHQHVGIFFSGGHDSRVVAACLPKNIRKSAYIFLREKNREYNLARLAAKLIGVDLHMIPLENDSYIRDLEARQSLVGPGVDTATMHAFGVRHSMPADLTYFGGWTSDTILKAHYERKKTKYQSRGPYQDDLTRRHKGRMASLRPLTRSGDSYQWQRYWPLSVHEHYGHFASSRRIYDMVEPFMFSSVFKIAAGCSLADKMSGRLFANAFTKKLGISGYIPRSGGEIIGLDERESRFAAPIVSALFAFNDHVLTPAAVQGPWSGPLRGVRLQTLFALECRQALLEFDNGSLAQLVAHQILQGKKPSMNRLLQIGEAIT